MTLVPELLATCWTSAGNVMPLRNGDRSPLPVERRIRAVAAAGYTGFGLSHADLIVARDDFGLSRLRELFAENQITHVELEVLDYWWTSGEQRAASDRVRADLLTAASDLGAERIKVGVGVLGDRYDPEDMRSSFSALATEAADAGATIALEPCAFSAMPTLHPAVGLVTDVAHPNGGLLLDIWHIYRSGLSYAELAEIVPPKYIFGVELDDGAAKQVGTGLEDTFDNRILCGEGDFDVVGFIAAVQSLGFQGVWGVEMMSTHHRTLEPEVAVSQAFDGAQRCLSTAAHRVSA